jgi:glyoxylate reductase
MAKPIVIATRRFPDAVEALLGDLFDARLRTDDRPMTRAELGAALRNCDVLAPTVTDRIDATLLAAAGPRLKLIANFGVGTDHIDLEAAAARGIAISNTPDVLTEDTADIFLALILSTARGLGEGERLLRAGQWTGWSPINLMGRSVTGKALAIVGMGRIGRALARRARACGMHIHYHNRRRLDAAAEDETGARWWPDLDPMLAAADFVALCCPYSAETHHLIDARRLSLMKRQAYLINAARGGVIERRLWLRRWTRRMPRRPRVYPTSRSDPRLLASKLHPPPHLGSAT